MLFDSLPGASDLINQFDARAALEFAAALDSGPDSTWGEKCRIATLMIPPADSDAQRRENVFDLIALATVAYMPKVESYCKSELQSVTDRLKKKAEKREKKRKADAEKKKAKKKKEDSDCD